MPVELKVPEVGESITQVQIGTWLVQEGQQAQKDQPLVEIETDKVTLELPAPIAGTVTQLLKKKGDTASVGEVIGMMAESGDGAPKPAAGGEAVRVSEQVAPKAGGRGAKVEREEEPGQVTVMPAARRELHERGLQAEQVQPTGPGGRLLKEDVRRHPSEAPEARQPAQPAPARETPEAREAKAPPAAPAAPKAREGEEGREEETVPMTPMRRRIAQRLVEAQHNAAMLTTFNEVDMTAVMELRNAYKDSFQERYKIKLGFMSFFVKAAVHALKLIPAVNAEVCGESIVYKNYYDIGVAIGGGKGLVVPVIRNAERLSFAEVEQTIADLAKRAQQNKITLAELQGGTFTISNGGIYGSMLSTPILNPPQSGILGMHAIQERPMAVNKQVVVRPMMYLALSYDHRIVDGREAVTFLKHIKEVIEQPSRMLLEI